MLYTPPELTRLGNFTQVTLGHPSWGWEWDSKCFWLNCVGKN